MTYVAFSAGTALQLGKLRSRDAVTETGGILYIGDGGESRNENRLPTKLIQRTKMSSSCGRVSRIISY